jgi:hypothetical protein
MTCISRLENFMEKYGNLSHGILGALKCESEQYFFMADNCCVFNWFKPLDY